MTTDTSTTFENLKLLREGAVAIVELDNPPMNVITMQAATELKAVCGLLAADEDVRTVVFRSSNRGLFSAGADVTLMARFEEGGEELLAEYLAIADVMDVIEQLPMPTVVQLEGIALGGGGTQRLPRLVGAGVATEMIMKGMRYDAAMALQKGLLHQVVPADELTETVLKFATSLAFQAPRALRHVKTLIRAAFTQPGQAGLELERELFRDLLSTQDVKEGITAATENRRAVYTGN